MTAARLPASERCGACPGLAGGPLEPWGDPAAPAAIVIDHAGPTPLPFIDFYGYWAHTLRRGLRAVKFESHDFVVTAAVACPMAPSDKAVIRAWNDRLAADLSAAPRRVVIAVGRGALAAIAPNVTFRDHVGIRVDSTFGPVVPVRVPQETVAQSTATWQDFILSLAVARWLTLPQEPRRRLTEVERFWRNVRKTEECWYWSGDRDGWGYGVFSANGKNVRAHRYAYEFLKAPIPAGLTIDHLCERRACVNPVHLEAVPAAVNTERQGSRLVRADRCRYR